MKTNAFMHFKTIRILVNLPKLNKNCLTGYSNIFRMAGRVEPRKEEQDKERHGGRAKFTWKLFEVLSLR